MWPSRRQRANKSGYTDAKAVLDLLRKEMRTTDLFRIVFAVVLCLGGHLSWAAEVPCPYDY